MTKAKSAEIWWYSDEYSDESKINGMNTSVKQPQNNDVFLNSQAFM